MSGTDKVSRTRLISTAEAVPAEHQHAKPCSDCPFSRKSLPGWCGGVPPDEYVQSAHSDDQIHCHVFIGPQCAGAAIYRRNVAKNPRDSGCLRLPADRELVFATMQEFLDHHKEK